MFRAKHFSKFWSNFDQNLILITIFQKCFVRNILIKFLINFCPNPGFQPSQGPNPPKSDPFVREESFRTFHIRSH